MSKPIVKFSLAKVSLSSAKEILPSPSTSTTKSINSVSAKSDLTLLVNSKIECEVEGDQCAFFSVLDITRFTTAPLIRFVCGMMNGTSGGRLYLGVDRYGVVRGCNITRQQVRS